MSAATISVGFSCQSRFITNGTTAPLPSMPFDWLISTRDAVLRALETDGSSMLIDVDQTAIFTMPTEKYQGVYSNGIFYWHDFERSEDRRLKENWRETVPEINAKYQRRWKQFTSYLRDSDIRKHLIISNSKINLTEFSDDDADFSNKFDLTSEYADRLLRTLTRTGANNFQVTFLLRTFKEYRRLLKFKATRDDVFNVRFAGIMGLPAAPQFASTVVAPVAPGYGGTVDELEGDYPEDVRIEAQGDRAVVTKKNLIWAEAVPFPGGYLFNFRGSNNVLTARLDRGVVVFSNNTRWERLSTAQAHAVHEGDPVPIFVPRRHSSAAPDTNGLPF